MTLESFLAEQTLRTSSRAVHANVFMSKSFEAKKKWKKKTKEITNWILTDWIFREMDLSDYDTYRLRQVLQKNWEEILFLCVAKKMANISKR